MVDIIWASAAELARAIRTKKISSEEVVNAFLQRIEKINPELNAVVQVAADAARAEAREADKTLMRGEIKGPLHGVPVTVKDAFETAGLVSTGGTRGRASLIPSIDATAVARLRAAGAIIVGKTNVPELSLAYETDNLVYGRTNNPYDLSRTPGGSSGGEAAVIAAGGSPLGLGSDTAGSIRVPSHFCGITGIKPTTGLVPTTGHFPLIVWVLEHLAAIGPMARRVEDLVLALPILAGPDGRDPAVVPVPVGDPGAVDIKRLRVAFHTDNGISTPLPETVRVVRQTAKVLSEAGIFVDEARPPGIDQTCDLMDGLLAADGGTGVRLILRIAGTKKAHPWTQQAVKAMRSKAVSITEFSGLMVRWQLFRSTMLSFLGKFDLILCPACSYPALPHGTTLSDQNTSAFSYAATYNLTGWPSVVLRGGTSPEGLPIGVQVVARPWREDVALAAAQHIETVLSGWQPPSM
ncbi:MAG: amidase [Ammonifex sp.]|jgi:amidase|nr:MAG: amidase [Ammonifex sp.]